tara:strand:- start:254 stop:424 length:171 start_codon:yes stop_codon:yes gene_type:complete
MKSLIAKLWVSSLALLIWYCILFFITNESNPFEWGVFVKIVFVVITATVIRFNFDD